MDMRTLGRSGISVAPLMLGGNVFGWTADQDKSFAILDAFVGGGFNSIDTANVYSRWIPGHTGGESETVIGHWLKARGGRDKVVIATKLGMDMGGENKGLSAAYMVKAVEESLTRLQTDYIDLYQSHSDDAATPLAETLEAYSKLIKAGKVRAIGASNYTADRLVEALKASKEAGIPRYETLQPLYNLTDRAGFEGALQDLCVKEDVAVIPFYGLASGFLTGKYRSEADFGKSPRGMRMGNYLNDRGKRILGALDQVADAHKSTPAQVALAWLAVQPSIAAPIASATSVEQLEDIMGAARLTLSAGDLKALDGASVAETASA
jgi:aryl-alcohol dehydrogenase-like predicted oxidoreductase